MRGDYEAAGTWPADAVEITTENHLALLAGQSDGRIIIAGADGMPVLANPAPTPYAQIAVAYLDTVRVIRDQILNRIMGIGFVAMQSGDTATAKSVTTARQALLDITKSPAVLAATDADTLKAAVLATYKSIVAAAPASLRNAFNAEGV
ncbi:hypothetical protein BA896_021770 [Janthinobacterium lividum]|uniref:Uncharacterized protein n=1 Tax=Janthinobacterium lividum TaxID=29581 RepID=A0A1E8PKI1_9BURK|nr:hypothetical protein BA896_021770 [Janthinobacterium lividum]